MGGDVHRVSPRYSLSQLLFVPLIQLLTLSVSCSHLLTRFQRATPLLRTHGHPRHRRRRLPLPTTRRRGPRREDRMAARRRSSTSFCNSAFRARNVICTEYAGIRLLHGADVTRVRIRSNVAAAKPEHTTQPADESWRCWYGRMVDWLNRVDEQWQGGKLVVYLCRERKTAAGAMRGEMYTYLLIFCLTFVMHRLLTLSSENETKTLGIHSDSNPTVQQGVSN